MIRWTTDKPARILAVIRELKFTVADPSYRGELARLAEDSVVRKAFVRRRGLVSVPDGAGMPVKVLRGLFVDELGEAFYDRGLCAERPTCAEVLDALDDLFQRSVPAKRASRDERRNVVAMLSAEQRKVITRRCRPYDCPECGDIAYHSGFAWAGRCECGEVYVCRDRTIDEIMREVAGAEASPF